MHQREQVTVEYYCLELYYPHSCELSINHRDRGP